MAIKCLSGAVSSPSLSLSPFFFIPIYGGWGETFAIANFPFFFLSFSFFHLGHFATCCTLLYAFIDCIGWFGAFSLFLSFFFFPFFLCDVFFCFFLCSFLFLSFPFPLFTHFLDDIVMIMDVWMGGWANG
ncbi:hypothetical protein HOY80DRAFT_288495 [Tuber brumale]|nr:hypothetical protein HOY80DRAFT_288495 [Tuber brumale]